MSLINSMTGYPWAITADAMQMMVDIVNRSNDIEAVRAAVGQPMNNSRKTEIRDGIAVIPVTGPIFRYANLFTEICGATSVQSLALDFNHALKDSEVRGILFDHDSPGGQANGIAEFSSMIANARGIKPIKAYAGGQSASASYWLSSAADEIIGSQTAMVGSIGAMMQIKDSSEAEKRDGVRNIKIVSSVSPRKNAEPSTEEGLADLQELVDTLGDIFVQQVAENRSVTSQHVLDNYGQGAIYVGEKALANGLIDSIGTFESALASFGTQKKGGSRRMTAQHKLNKIKMEETQK